MKYRPEIDGLRAVAVLSIFFYHLGLKNFSGGFVGVDIFFVISGFLITSIIYNDLTRGTFTFAKFYERRFRRIIPALYVVLIFTCVITYKYFMLSEFENFSQSLLSIILFFSNFLFAYQSGYFSLDSEVKPLLHTWSLSIEEQFYILFPVILLFIFNKKKKHLAKIIVFLCIASFFSGVISLKYNATMAFYFIHSRAWELLLGSLIAVGCFPKIKSEKYNNALSFIGLLMIFYSIFIFSKKTLFPGVNAAVPCIGSALIIYSSIHDQFKTWVGSILSTRPMVWIGKISYSLYLWHWPVIVFVKYYLIRQLTLNEQLIILATVIFISFLSWRFVEQPFRTKTRGLENNKIIFPSIVFISLCMVIYSLLGGYIQKGLPGRLPQQVIQYSEGAYDTNPNSNKCHKEGLQRIQEGKLCDLGEKKNIAPQFLVWGDSFADAMMPELNSLAEKNHIYGLLDSSSNCTPLLGVKKLDLKFQKQCVEFNEGMISFIEKYSIKNVILVSRWPTSGIAMESEEDNVLKSKDGTAAFTYGLDNVFERLTKNHTKIWIIAKTPESTYDIPSVLGRSAFFGKPTSVFEIPMENFQKSSEKFNHVLAEIQKKYEIHILRPENFLCSAETQKCKIESEGRSLYSDHAHLSTFGTYYVEPALLEFFDDLKKQSM